MPFTAGLASGKDELHVSDDAPGPEALWLRAGSSLPQLLQSTTCKAPPSRHEGYSAETDVVNDGRGPVQRTHSWSGSSSMPTCMSRRRMPIKGLVYGQAETWVLIAEMPVQPQLFLASHLRKELPACSVPGCLPMKRPPEIFRHKPPTKASSPSFACCCQIHLWLVDSN